MMHGRYRSYVLVLGVLAAGLAVLLVIWGTNNADKSRSASASSATGDSTSANTNDDAGDGEHPGFPVYLGLSRHGRCVNPQFKVGHAHLQSRPCN